MDLYAMEILAHLEDFPVAQAVLVQAAEATENLSHVAIFFFYLFYFFPYLLVPTCFPKGKKRSILGQKTKMINKTICPWYSFQ